MCEVCERKGKLIDTLRPFLATDVQAEYEPDPTAEYCEKLWLKRPDGSVLHLTADGDSNGYFHWKETT